MKLNNYSKNSLLLFLIFIILLATQYYGSYLLASLNFAYPNDDVYSQLSLASNFANSGIWGILEGQFSSSSNYILYTLIIAAHNYLGFESVFVPLLFNCIAALGSIIVFGKYMRTAGISSNKFVVFGMLFIFALPLHYLAFMALGDILHIWLLLTALLKFVTYLSKDNHKEKGILSISIIMSLAVLANYTSLFAIPVLVILFLIKKQLSNAILFTLISTAPIVLFGTLSVLSGGYFIPNDYMVIVSDISNSNFSFFYVLTNWVYKLISHYEVGIGILIIIISLFFSYSKVEKKSMLYFSIISLCMFILHAATIPFYDNGLTEAYLTALSLICFANIANAIFYKKYYNLAIVIVILAFITLRTAPFTYENRNGIKNIYNQQFQIAEFVSNNLDGVPIVVSSPGLVSYYTDNELFDLSMKEASPMLDYYITNGKMIEDLIAISADNISASVAIIYEDRYKDLLPREWVKLATWTIGDISEEEKRSVHFYNISTNELKLLTALKQFESELPESVKVSYTIEPPKENIKIIPYLLNGHL